MQVTHSLDAVSLSRPAVVTVGVFDGVHVGHQQLIRQVVSAAQTEDYAAVVVSFFPHPDKVLKGIEGRFYLTPPDEKARLLAEMGVDVLVLHPFDESVRHMPAAYFVDQLQEHVNLIEFWATPDFAMGYQREGDIPFLIELGKVKGFTVDTMPLVNSNGDHISSSHIRDLLQSGDLAHASRLLGRPYRISGEVVHGAKRGRTIGFPTANIRAWPEQLLPAFGVYACHAMLGDEQFLAVTNIGNRPTFDGQDVTIEAHILEFDREIYGQILALDFLHYLRGEQKFSGIEAIKEQIARDVETARERLA